MPPRGSKRVSEHKCQYCSYLTHRKSFMNDHIRVHTGEKPFSCDTCGKSFSQKSNLRQHLKVHNQGNNRFYGCNLCDFKTKWKSSLQVHERMHNGEKPYKCKICDRAFSQSTHCQTHMREAHLNMRKFQCDVCSKTFKRHEHLERHMAFHKMERNYECDVCHKKYLDARYLKQHKRIHEGDASKIHECSVCPYKSRYKQGLRIHTRTHTGVRPYKCEDCGKAFVTRQSLKLHNRMVHQGTAGKIFHCDQCSFSTANKQNLRIHLLKIHMGLSDKITFRCKFCNVVLKTKGALSTHMAKVHPKQIKEEQRLRQQRKPPPKVIGSLSRSPVLGAGSPSKNRISMMLKKRAVSPKPVNIRMNLSAMSLCQAVSIKKEAGVEEVPTTEYANGVIERNIQTMLSGKTEKSNGNVEEYTSLKTLMVKDPLGGKKRDTVNCKKQKVNGKNGEVSKLGQSTFGKKKNGITKETMISELKENMEEQCNNHNDSLVTDLVKKEDNSHDDEDVLIVNVDQPRERKRKRNQQASTKKEDSTTRSTSPRSTSPRSTSPKSTSPRSTSPRSTSPRNTSPRKTSLSRAKSPKRSGKDFLRIKLNTPKASKNKTKPKAKSNETNKTGKSQLEPVPVELIKVSPSSGRIKNKSPVPSAERARKLFVSPDIYIDRDSEAESNGGSISPLNHSTDEPELNSKTSSSRCPGGEEEEEDLQVVECHMRKAKKSVDKKSRQYDSLRDIISEFHNLSDIITDKKTASAAVAMETTPPPSLGSKHDNGHMIHETIEGENGELIEIHMMKEEQEEREAANVGHRSEVTQIMAKNVGQGSNVTQTDKPISDIGLTSIKIEPELI